MTTTNQAFIKVYRRDEAQAGPSGLATAGDDRLTTAALGSSVEFVVATTGSGSRSASRRATVPNQLATSIDVLPPTARSSAGFGFLFKAGLGESGRASRNHPPSRVDAAGRIKRPLSAFLGRQTSNGPAIAEPTTTRHRAGTTVASLRWPPICRALGDEGAAQFDRLADVLQDQIELGRSLFGVMGLFPGSGSTTIALTLATKLAGAGHRVILVEGSFYEPRLAEWLDVEPTAGWQDVLNHAAPLSDALVHTVDEKLDVLLVCGTPPFDPLPLVGGRQATSTALELRRRYELALVDLGPFFDPRSQPIALELARNMGIDAVLAVGGPQPIDERDLATVAEHLEGSGCELLGIIENRIAKSHKSHLPSDT